MSGKIYIICSHGQAYFKIGFTKGSVKELLKRYKTYYGHNLSLVWFEIPHGVHACEKTIHNSLKQYRVDGEKYYLEHYQKIKQNIKQTLNQEFKIDIMPVQYKPVEPYMEWEPT